MQAQPIFFDMIIHSSIIKLIINTPIPEKKPEVARKQGSIALELSKWRTKCWGRTKKFECM